MTIGKKWFLTIVAISIVIGALTGVAGYFLGLGGGVTGGITGAICGATAAFLLRQPSR